MPMRNHAMLLCCCICRYLVSFYYVIVTIGTVGYGESLLLSNHLQEVADIYDMLLLVASLHWLHTTAVGVNNVIPHYCHMKTCHIAGHALSNNDFLTQLCASQATFCHPTLGRSSSQSLSCALAWYAQLEKWL